MLRLAAAETYTGATTVSATIPDLQGAGSLSASSPVVLKAAASGLSAIFDTSPITAASTSVAGLYGASDGFVLLGSKRLTLTAASGDFDGFIQDNGGAVGVGGGLTLAGGTHTLSGANTYTGATLVNGGVLAVDGSLTSAVANGGTVRGTRADAAGITVRRAGRSRLARGRGRSSRRA